MEPSRGPSQYDYPWRFEPDETPRGSPLLRSRGAKNFLMGTGVAAVATCVVLGGAALANSGTDKPALTKVNVAGANGNVDATVGDGGIGAGVPTVPMPPAPSTLPKVPKAPKTSAPKGSSGGAGTNGGGVATAPPSSPPEVIMPRGYGIVTIKSVLSFGVATSEGTGMVLTSGGDVLTNNHVIRDATSIRVTVKTTGKSYRADVLGSNPSADVAVLHLRGASGLPVAEFGDASDVARAAVNSRVIAVGNAYGKGKLVMVRGEITALGQSVTATDEQGKNAEHLTGLILTSANIVGGDSGGPLYDTENYVIGIDTAAVTHHGHFGRGRGDTQSFAIPITKALTIAHKIEAGSHSAKIHLGLPAFLGVEVVDGRRGGAAVKAVLRGGPAARAGITAGALIVGIDGRGVASATSLHDQVAALRSGQRVAVTWFSALGMRQTATVSLTDGPAD